MPDTPGVVSAEIAGGIAVKPLEWERDGTDLYADTPIGQYSVGKLWDGYGAILRCIVGGGQYDKDISRGHATVGIAKAAAQADYASRILSALDTDALTTYGQARFEAGLEEAAKVADVEQNDHCGGACHDIGAAIRNLSKKEQRT